MVTVQYWSLPLQDLSQADTLLALLSVDEKGRSQRYKFPELQQRFVCARGKLRQILGHYLNQNPAEITFRYGEYGKPFVEGIAFNFSHTTDLALCAVVLDQDALQLGVDLEKGDRQIKALSLAKRFFAPTEYHYLQNIAEDQQADTFLKFWTAKEAYLKAQGTGLQGGLDQVIINLNPQPHFTNVEAGNWSVKLFQPDRDHWGAIAINQPDCELIDRGEWQ